MLIFKPPQEIATLKKQLVATTQPIARVDLLNTISYNCRFDDFPEAIALAEKALALADSPNGPPYPQGIADSLTNLSWFNLDQTHYDLAHQQSLQALDIYRDIGDQEGVAMVMGRIGRLHLYWGDYSEALRIHVEQLEMCEARSFQHEKAVALNGIGNIYSRLGQTDESIQYYQKSLTILEAFQDDHRSCGCILNIGLSYAIANQTSTALTYCNRGLALAQRLNNQHWHSWALLSMGKIYAQSDDATNAMDYMLQHVALARHINDRQQLVDALTNIGQFSLQQANYDAAQGHLEEALALTEQHGMTPHQFECHQLLCELAKTQGEFELALQHHEQFHRLKEAVFNEEKDKRFVQIESIHAAAMARQEAEILRLKTEELEKRVAERTNELARTNQNLAEAMAREAELNQLRSQIITTVSHEFRTPLTVINNSAEIMIRHNAKLNDTKRGEIHERIRNSIFYLSDLLKDISLVDATNKEGFQFGPLPMLFVDFCERLQSDCKNAATHLEFRFAGDENALLNIDYSLVLQVVENYVTNAVKYSPPDSPILISTTLNGSLQIAVTDSGIGVPAAELEKIWALFYRASNVDMRRGLGLGLYNVKQLADVMGGLVSAESAGPNQGSTFSLAIPYHQPK